MSTETDKCFIGSTEDLKSVFSIHRKHYNRNESCKCSELMKYADVEVVILEEIVASKCYLKERERIHSSKEKNCVNHQEQIGCVCGGCFKNTNFAIKQHINGEQHKRKMHKLGLEIDSTDGKTIRNMWNLNNRSIQGVTH
jgi:hypothetical protein